MDRALTILSLLGTGEAISVTRAQRELSVAPSTAHRILATLVGRDFAIQGKDRLYRAGPALISAGRARPNASITATFRPFLEMLYNSIEETVNLMVLKGDDVLFLDGIEGKQNLRVGLRTGIRMPAHLTSGGKAMLALRREGYPTDKIFVSLNPEQSEKGVTAISVALGKFNRYDVAIAIAIPSSRMTPDRERRLERELRNLHAKVHQAIAL